MCGKDRDRLRRSPSVIKGIAKKTGRLSFVSDLQVLDCLLFFLLFYYRVDLAVASWCSVKVILELVLLC